MESETLSPVLPPSLEESLTRFSSESPPSQSSSLGLGGRAVKVFHLGVDACDKLFNDIGAITNLTRLIFYSLTAGLALNCFRATERWGGLCSRLERVQDYLDGTRFPTNWTYFVDDQEHKSARANHKVLFVAAAALGAAGDVAGAALWMRDMGIQTVGRLTASIGRLPLLSQTGIGLLGLTRGLFAASGLLTMLDLSMEIGRAQVLDESNKTRYLRLAATTSQVALTVFMMLGGTSLPVIVGLGVLASGLGLASFFHGKYAQPKKEERVGETLLVEEEPASLLVNERVEVRA